MIMRKIASCLSIALVLSISCLGNAATLTEILEGKDANLNTVTEKLPILVDYTTTKFKDVSKDSWYINSIAKLMGLGGIEGYPDGTFSPDGETTAGEFTKLLLATVGYKQNIAEGNEWYKNYISEAKELGVIEATDTYDYNGGMNRAGMAKMICKMLKLSPKKSDKSIFNDTVDADTTWIDTAFQEYLIRGYYSKGQRTFAPDQAATRAEVSEMIVRVLEYKQNPEQYKKDQAEYYATLEKKQDASDTDDHNPQTPESYINYVETLDLVSGFNPPDDFVVPQMRIVHDDPNQADWFYVKLDNLLDYKDAGNYLIKATCTNVDLTNTYIDTNGDKQRLDDWSDPMFFINHKAKAMTLWGAGKTYYSESWQPDSYRIKLKDGDVLDIEVIVKNDTFEQVYRKSVTVHIP